MFNHIDRPETLSEREFLPPLWLFSLLLTQSRRSTRKGSIWLIIMSRQLSKPFLTFSFAPQTKFVLSVNQEVFGLYHFRCLYSLTFFYLLNIDKLSRFTQSQQTFNPSGKRWNCVVCFHKHYTDTKVLILTTNRS